MGNLLDDLAFGTGAVWASRGHTRARRACRVHWKIKIELLGNVKYKTRKLTTIGAKIQADGLNSGNLVGSIVVIMMSFPSFPVCRRLFWFYCRHAAERGRPVEAQTDVVVGVAAARRAAHLRKSTFELAN